MPFEFLFHGFADAPPPPAPVPEELEPSEQVEQLRFAILEKLDAVRELRTKLRTEYVPSSVCTYLAQCLKDTEVTSLSHLLHISTIFQPLETLYII